jgi:hypothetical protein
VLRPITDLARSTAVVVSEGMATLSAA